MTDFVTLRHQISKTMEYRISTIMDQNGLPFVEAPDGGIDFGQITVEQNLPPAPIRLSIGDRNNGLMHIEFVTATKLGKPVLCRLWHSWHTLRKTTIVSRRVTRTRMRVRVKAKPTWCNLPTSITIRYGCNCRKMTPIGTSIVRVFCRKDTVETRKTSGLLPNCRMRNRLPVILRSLQQMPIKRQAQTVLYPMFPIAKIQLFHNMQLYFQKLTQNNDDMPKITTFVPLKMNRVRSVSHRIYEF